MTQPAPPADRAPPSVTRFYLIHAGLPALLTLALLVVFQVTDLDRALSDLFYDPAARQFPLRYAWFLEVVLHQWAKYLLVVIGCGTLAGFVASFGVPALRAQRRTLLFVFLAMVLGPLAAGAVKEFSSQHCPHNLEIYGGRGCSSRRCRASRPGSAPRAATPRAASGSWRFTSSGTAAGAARMPRSRRALPMALFSVSAASSRARISCRTFSGPRSLSGLSSCCSIG